MSHKKNRPNTVPRFFYKKDGKEQNMQKNAQPWSSVNLHDFCSEMGKKYSKFITSSSVHHMFHSNSGQYIMAQAPFDKDTQADFFRMLSQTRPGAVVFMDAHDSEDAK